MRRQEARVPQPEAASAYSFSKVLPPSAHVPDSVASLESTKPKGFISTPHLAPHFQIPSETHALETLPGKSTLPSPTEARALSPTPALHQLPEKACMRPSPLQIGQGDFGQEEVIDITCVICGDDINMLTFLERELHMNRCLDRRSGTSADRRAPRRSPGSASLTCVDLSGKVDKNHRDSLGKGLRLARRKRPRLGGLGCPICNKRLKGGEANREIHVHECLERATTEEFPLAEDVSKTWLPWRCPVCETHMDGAYLPAHRELEPLTCLPVQTRRLGHLKRCASSLGVNCEELRERLGLPPLSINACASDSEKEEEEEDGEVEDGEVFAAAEAQGNKSDAVCASEADVDGSMCNHEEVMFERDISVRESVFSEEIQKASEDVGFSQKSEDIVAYEQGINDQDTIQKGAPTSAFAFLMATSRSKTAPPPTPGQASWFPTQTSVQPVLAAGKGRGKGKGKGGGKGWGGRKGQRKMGSTRSLSSVPSFKVLPLTSSPPIIVDGFEFASSAVTDVYVLTHFHSDHYGPLTGKAWADLGSQGCIIYCSEVTAALVEAKLGVSKRFLRPLPVYSREPMSGSPDGSASGSTDVLPKWTRLKDGRGQGLSVDVVLVDANHCPGAAMFLFRHRQTAKTVLHVGDFRWKRDQMVPLISAALANPKRGEDSTPSSKCKKGTRLPLAFLTNGKFRTAGGEQPPPSLHATSSSSSSPDPRIILDYLFLDTTYCNPSYTFPSQASVIDETALFVAKLLREAHEPQQDSSAQEARLGWGALKPDTGRRGRLLILFGSYSIGKERLYMAVADRLGLKVCNLIPMRAITMCNIDT